MKMCNFLESDISIMASLKISVVLYNHSYSALSIFLPLSRFNAFIVAMPQQKLRWELPSTMYILKRVVLLYNSDIIEPWSSCCYFYFCITLNISAVWCAVGNVGSEWEASHAV